MNRYVIIGNCAAGISAVEAIRRQDREGPITVISDEANPPYCRCLISNYLAGDISRDKLLLRPHNFYKDNKIEALLGKKVVRLDAKKNRVILDDRSQIYYDKLLVASGSSPKFPQIKGINKRRVFGLRKLSDVSSIIELLSFCGSACVLGGGPIGLKAAYALKKKGLEVKVIVKSKQVLSQMLDEKAAAMFRETFVNNGIEVLTEADVVEIIGNGEAKAVKLENGKVIGADIVIVAKGVKPNIDFLSNTEVKLDQGILVDDFLRTAVSNIFAAGDVCQAIDVIFGKPRLNALWPHAVRQAEIAGLNMVSSADLIRYEGSIAMNSVDFFGLSAVSIGLTRPQDPACEELTYQDSKRGIYKRLIIRENRIVGMVFVGDIRDSGLILRIIMERADVSAIKEELLAETFNYAKALDILNDSDLSVPERVFRSISNSELFQDRSKICQK
jgi:NAD(P)H-nitrite reductase large subunit